MTVVSDGGAAGSARASGRVRRRREGREAVLIARLIALRVDLAMVHPAPAAVVKRLGGEPVVVEFAAGAARIEVAARARHRDLASGLLTMDVT
jgi:hypothetical protein